MIVKLCQVLGCTNGVLAKGLCHKHYESARRAKRRTSATRWARKSRSATPEYAREKVRAQRSKKRAAIEAAHRPCPATCECCNGPPVGRGIKGRTPTLHHDHDHITGAFRGWLCSRCNTGIGLLGDSPHGVANAARYLARAP